MRREALIVTPAPAGSRKGNRVTALRWAAMLRSLGWRVRLAARFDQRPCALLVALHAGRSAASVAAARAAGAAPIVVALTGTDLYLELAEENTNALASLALADRLIILQPRARAALPPAFRDRARVIAQSCTPPSDAPSPSSDAFEVCVIGHLRSVKDPFRAALAAQRLAASSRLRVLHVGAALDPALAEEARRHEAASPRYRWLGERSRRETLRILAASRALVHSSWVEGGANVMSEAIVCGTPVLSSRVEGSIGLLGEDFPGYFSAGDTDALATLLDRAETDPAFLDSLRAWQEPLRARFTPAAEREAWRSLLRELFPAHQP